MKLPTAAGVAVLLLVNTVQAEVCPPSCICKSPKGTKIQLIDCSSRGLKEVPALPASTKQLYLQNNSLTTVPTGVFDGLVSLEEVNVLNNPWNCDCHILYLKLWLEDFNSSLTNLSCASPASIEGKPLNQLSGNELDGCRALFPIKCLEFFWRDLVLIIFAIIALILMAYDLKHFKKLAIKLL